MKPTIIYPTDGEFAEYHGDSNGDDQLIIAEFAEQAQEDALAGDDLEDRLYKLGLYLQAI